MLLLGNNVARAQTDQQKEKKNKAEWGVEYYYPMRAVRDIETFSINALYGKEWDNNWRFSLLYGATTTTAWGRIIQSERNRKDIVYENRVLGFGPIFSLKVEPITYENFSLAPEFLGGIIFYSERFPVGGDIYNFMWRIGGSVNYTFPKSDYVLSLNFRRMHVSNGQRGPSKNPSYEALGYGITLIKYLKPIQSDNYN